MADNVVAAAGSGGSTFATDDISGVHYPLSKLAFGALDTATLVSTAAGLPVQQQGTFTVTGSGGSFPVTDSAGSLTVDAPVGTPVFVRLSDGTAAITTLPVSGTFFQATQPVSLASVPSHAVTNAGTFAVQAAQSGTFTVQPGNTANSTAWLVTGTAGTFPVTDSGGTLTVDAPVGTPAFVRLSDGTSAIATLPVSLASLPALVAGTANIGDVDVLTLPALVAGNANIGDVDVASIAAGTNAIGDVGSIPRTSGGLSMSKTVSAATTNATVVKASAGQVYSVQVFNVNAAARYLKLYNKATSPTVGTDVPVKTILIPGNTAGAGTALKWTQGLAFSAGISFALTTGVADADVAAVAASEIVVNVDYA